MITVFTPTYNRGYIIKNLYDSLCVQSCKDFEWLIVDDGSTDNTEDLIQSLKNENKIDIKYIKLSNGGKHRAINCGVQEAAGELFFIVDSDDRITPDAISIIEKQYFQIAKDSSFAGVCGIKAYFNGNKVGGERNFGILDCTSLDFRYKYHIGGDMAEVFRTKVLKEFPFPEIKDEYFCPEALVWNRIAVKYKLRYFYEKIYLCEYLPDGLTAKIVTIRKNSPITSMLYYSELKKMRIPFLQKIKATINYWRFSFCSEVNIYTKVNQIGASSLVILPIGFLFYIMDCRK